MSAFLSISLFLLLCAVLFFIQKKANFALMAILTLTGITSITITFILTQINNHKKIEILNKEMLTSLSELRAKLEMGINSNTLLIHGLSSFVSINPNLSQEEFRKFSQSLMKQHSNIINFGAAPNMVIQYVYPLEGNQKIIGLDYRKNDAQTKAAQKAINVKKIIVAGPVDLIQGGKAFIGRTATFTLDENGDQKFWGLVSAPISQTKLYKDSGVDVFERHYNLAIRGKDCSGPTGEVFYGDPNLFNREHIDANVTLPYGSWLIAAELKDNPKILFASQLGYWPFLWIFIILISFFSYLFVKSQNKISESAELLYHSETLFRIMFENSPVGIALLDSKFNHLKLNDSYKRILGYSENEILNQNFKFVTSEDSTEIENNELAQFALNNKISPYIKTVIRKDNQKKIVNVAGIKAIESDEQKVWVFIDDITNEKNYESNILREREIAVEERKKAEAAVKVKSIFLSTMSHEIRTPINGIIVSADLLNDENLTKEQKEYAEIIYRSGNLLLSLINDILDLAKLDAGKMQIETIPVDLFQLCKDLHNSLKPMADEKKIDLFLSISDEFQNKLILSDPTRLAQLITNLCSNAIKFTKQGIVKIQVSRENDEFIIEIQDSGIGMSLEQTERIFDPFTQVDSSISRKFGGTGLGLSICKSICELMKGHILINSQENVGTTFTIKMPLIWAIIDKGKIDEPKKLTRNYNLKALLVDDNDINILVGSKLLEKIGIQVDIAKNGREAIQNLKEYHQIVFMDIQMPEMNGIEAFKEIRKMGCSTPIFALTANVMSEDVDSYLKIGFNRVLAKPFNLADVVKTLDEFNFT